MCIMWICHESTGKTNPYKSNFGYGWGKIFYTYLISHIVCQIIFIKEYNENSIRILFLQRSVLMICSYMPGTILDKCEEFVNTYGDEIIQDIIEMEMNPDEVCASLGMCTASKWNTKEKVNPYQES